LRWISLVPAEIVYWRAAKTRLKPAWRVGNHLAPWFHERVHAEQLAGGLGDARSQLGAEDLEDRALRPRWLTAELARPGLRKRVKRIASQSMASWDSLWRTRGSSHAVWPLLGSRRATAMRLFTARWDCARPSSGARTSVVVVETVSPDRPVPERFRLGDDDVLRRRPR